MRTAPRIDASTDASPEARAFRLERFVPYRLSVLSNTVSEGIAQTYRDEFGLSVTEWRVIAVIGRYPGLSASEVVERTAMDKVAIHRAVKRLEERGLVQRDEHATDRRRRSLSLSPDAGLPVFEEIVPRARRYEEALLADLDERELAQFGRLLGRLEARARALAATDATPEN